MYCVFAIVHTLFNAINTVLLLPIKKLIIKFCEVVVPDKEEKQHTVFLDERIFNNVALAIDECTRLTVEMANYSRTSIFDSIKLMDNFDANKVEEIRALESLIDKYEDKLGTYLVRLSNHSLSEKDSHKVARLLHGIGDFERMGDHALNICKVAEEMHTKNIKFSDEATKELATVTEAITEILDMTVDSFINNDAETASHVEPLEQVIDKLKKTLKARHVARLQNNECTIELGFVFTDLLSNYERVSDHCSNIAVYTMQLSSDTLDTHKYLRKIKNSNVGEFMDDYNMYEKKYSV